MTIPKGDQALAAWVEEMGLAKIWEQDPDAVRKGAAAAAGFVERLSRDHVAADEPAHVFQADRHAIKGGGGND